MEFFKSVNSCRLNWILFQKTELSFLNRNLFDEMNYYFSTEAYLMISKNILNFANKGDIWGYVNDKGTKMGEERKPNQNV